MTTRSVDNYQNIENYNDVVDVLVQENAVNNTPNGNNFGEICVWNGSTWALEGSSSIGIGSNSGFFQQGGNSIAIGVNSARHNQGQNSIALVVNSGRTHQSTGAISIGSQAGSQTQGQNAVAIGTSSGQINQSDWAISIGNLAGNDSQKNNAISIGAGSGFFNQGTNSVALGLFSGQFNQGQNSVAIGQQAGITSQPESSIIINAGNSVLNGITQNSYYINPIRNVVTGGSTSNYLCYDSTNREVVQATNLSFVNPVSFPLGTVTQSSVNFGTLNTGIWSSSANSVNLSVAGTQRMDITGSRLSFNVPVQNVAGSQGSPSIYFSTDTTSGIYRPGLNNVGISTNGILRCNVTTSSIVCAIPITLPTTGGTASNLDYYEETTFASGWTYGNAAIGSITMTIVRIGRQTTLYIPISASATNTNGSASNITLNTSFPSRFRPNSGAGFPNNTSVVFVANSLSWIN